MARREMTITEFLQAFFKAIVESWKLILFGWLGTCALAFTVIWMIPREYRSTATLLPLDQRGPNIGGGAGSVLASLAGIQPIMNTSDILMSMLKSDSLKRAVLLENESILKFVLGTEMGLDQLKSEPNWESFTLPNAILSLGDMVRVVDRLKGPIEISARSSHPEINSKLVQAYVDALVQLSKDRTMTQATKKRQFTEELLADRRKEVQEVHRRLLSFDDFGNMQELSPAIVPVMEELSQLVRRQASYEMYLEFLKNYAPESKTEHAKLQDQLNDIERRRDALVKGLNINWKGTRGSETRSLNRIPVLGIEYLLLKAKAKTLGEVVSTISRELELARIEEVSEQVSFQVLDQPYASQIPVYPPRIFLICVVSFLSALGFSLAAFFRQQHVG